MQLSSQSVTARRAILLSPILVSLAHVQSRERAADIKHALLFCSEGESLLSAGHRVFARGGKSFYL